MSLARPLQLKARVTESDATVRTEHQPDRFDQLFTRRYGELYALAYRTLGDAALAEDVVQEAFLRLSEAEPVQRQADDAVGAWLRRVCLNLSFNRVRDERRLRQRVERAGRLDLASEVTTPSEALLAKERQTAVRQALHGLPDSQRQCLLLRHSGYSYAEIAATVGISVGSVGVYLARAERAFRERYQEREEA